MEWLASYDNIAITALAIMNAVLLGLLRQANKRYEDLVKTSQEQIQSLTASLSSLREVLIVIKDRMEHDRH